ncbi:MAG: Era-like GTP-binding protein [Candidatus Aenigmatarchaeota archaeon]
MFRGFLNWLRDIFGLRKNIKLGIYGDVNVGKTTLANRISLDWTGEEVGKVSEIPHETRVVQKKEKIEIRLKNNKKIFLNILDMPGLATKIDYRNFLKYGLSTKEAKKRAREATEGVIEAIKWLKNVDAVLAVMDATKDPLTQVNITLLGNLEARKIPVIIVANKVDLKKAKPKRIKECFPQYPVVPVSALTGKNIDQLYEAIGNYLVKGG